MRGRSSATGPVSSGGGSGVRRSRSPTQPTSGAVPVGSGSLGGGFHRGASSVEPIHVAVRLRPLREVAPEEAERHDPPEVSVWRAEVIGDQSWVCLAEGTPRVHAGAPGGSSTRHYEKAKFGFDLCFDETVSNR